MQAGGAIAVPAIYRRPFAGWLGEGAFQAFKNLDVLDANFAQLGLEPGGRFEYKGGAFRIVRARGALTNGGILKMFLGNAQRQGTLSANSTAAIVESGQTFVKGDLVGGNLFIKSGTGVGQLREVLANDAAAATSHATVAKYDSALGKAAISTPDAFSPAPDNTSGYSVVCGWEVVETSAVTDYVVAVSLGIVTSGNWTIVQEAGYALVKAIGSTDAITQQGPLVPSATGGTAKGFTTAGETVAEARLSFGIGLDAYSGAADLRHSLLWGRFRS